MRGNPGCSACTFVSHQLGPGMPCPFHAGLSEAATADESLVTADLHSDEPSAEDVTGPTAERLGQFTLHAYARLLVLRSHVRQRRKSGRCTVGPEPAPLHAEGDYRALARN